MKKIIKVNLLLFLLASSIGLNNCQKENESLTGTLMFQFHDLAKSNNLKSEPVASAVIVTIKTLKGVSVYDKEKLELMNMNGTYISKSLSLPKGSYQLVEFLITDNQNKIIYVTPLFSSKYASLVQRPLPFFFDIGVNTEIILSPDVIMSDQYLLSDLGYAGFSFIPVKTIKFLITVYSNNGLEPVDSSDLSITSPSGRFYVFKLMKKVANAVLVNEDSGNFVLKVSKPAYETWIDTLSNSELIKYATQPLHVLLMPSENQTIWFKSAANDGGYYGPRIFTFYDSDFWVDWGNGTTEKLRTKDGVLDLIKESLPGTRLVKVTGDMNSIRGLSFNTFSKAELYVDMNIRNAVKLENFLLTWATSLSNFSLANMHSLKTVKYSFCTIPLDVTNCENLESLIMAEVSMAPIDIHTNNALKYLIFNGQSIVFGDNPLLNEIYIFQSIEHANEIFADILKSVEKHPREGKIKYVGRGTNPEEVLNDQGKEAVRKLREVYHWTIEFGVTTRPF